MGAGNVETSHIKCQNAEDITFIVNRNATSAILCIIHHSSDLKRVDIIHHLNPENTQEQDLNQKVDPEKRVRQDKIIFYSNATEK